ncbi:MAG: DUF4260 domain-containing protein [Methylobacter sp.]|uniref:DUF4260 family protein n=1 Tax=Methylobacter sp. TaxID=2051955 RepID=UPI0025E7E9F4|nr:DUF4260 family protein [Methylobacter sp.]MCK9622442.1 DUF4260 domain-containing protein [Methylobacter sp.]
MAHSSAPAIIGFDRALGYGLKNSSGFGFTHLGRIGKFPEITHRSAFKGQNS